MKTSKLIINLHKLRKQMIIKKIKKETADISQTNEKKETSNESLQTSDKDNKKSTETNSKNDNSINDEIFFGDWTITGTAASGHVTIYSTEDIKKIIGTKIYYGVDPFFNNIFFSPF